ncbi:FMT1 [Candida theae]|uniref:Methionyl-tRNA formyltransferase, mitochondrial n=1 Tax=Candida theae TaxID=1198502 RepID=A0AAD5BFM3_9ASCO|nr:FMT1 [Candida theae]KAI5958654.1 FMT1 [Candida theae]
MRISLHPIARTSKRFIHFKHDPLNIAFFGSGDFSVSSLGKILELQKRCPEKISSVKVITRSLKPSGRYLKTLAELPISEFAKSHDIPILRADTSNEIIDLTQRNNFNLTIAVSYGKLIPAEFLNKCAYGGLNVHPSLLPKYSGSSPIQYALLNDDKTTGVTVQSLHPTKFDHGRIIAQSDELEVKNDDDFDTLSKRLAQEGGQLLSDVIEKGLFLTTSRLPNIYERSLAPKIDKSKSQALWKDYNARQIKRLNDAIGPVYTFINTRTKKKGQFVDEKKRVILSEVTELKDQHNMPQLRHPGDFSLIKEGLCIKCKTGYVVTRKIKLQTRGDESPEKFIGSYHKTVGDAPPLFID